LRREQAASAARGLSWRMARAQQELSGHGEAAGDDQTPPASGDERIAAIESELAEIDSRRADELQGELAGLHETGERQDGRVRELERELLAAREARARADELVQKAREGSVWSV